MDHSSSCARRTHFARPTTLFKWKSNTKNFSQNRLLFLSNFEFVFSGCLAFFRRHHFFSRLLKIKPKSFVGRVSAQPFRIDSRRIESKCHSVLRLQKVRLTKWCGQRCVSFLLSLSLSVSTDCRHYAVKSHLWLCWTLFFRNQRNWKQKKISWFSSLAIIDFIKNRFNNILRTFSVHSEFIVIDSTTDLALPFVFNTFSYTWNIYKLIASNEKWSARGKTTERITIIDHNRVNKPKGFVLFSSRLTRSQRKIGFSFRDPSASLAHNYYVFNALQDDERRRLCDGVTVNVNGVAGKWTPFVAAVPQRASKQASKQARAGVRIVKLNWIYIIILPEYMGRRNFLIIVFRVSDVSTKVYVRRSLRGA